MEREKKKIQEEVENDGYSLTSRNADQYGEKMYKGVNCSNRDGNRGGKVDRNGEEGAN